MATTIRHNAAEGETHGGVYLIDLVNQTVDHPVRYDFPNIDWFGQEGERGLRGAAIDGDVVYVTAGNRLLAFDRQFKQIGSWTNPYLANCQGISIFQRELFLACAGNDCVLAFDLEERKFHWAMHVVSEHFQFRPVPFDPASSEGPIPVNKLHLRSIQCSQGGVFLSGMKTGGLLHFNGSKIQMLAELPQGAQDPQVFRKGIVFNDSRAGVLRYAGSDDGQEDRALPIPYFESSDHQPHDSDESRIMKRGYGRGLCVLSPSLVAVGATPAGIHLFDLKGSRKLASVWFTKDTLEAVNSIIEWPE